MAWIFFGLVMALVALRLMVVVVSPKAIRIRPTTGKLAECPSSPTCVSSQTDRTEQKVEPLKYSGPSEEAKLRLRLAIEAMPGTKVLQEDRIYLHAEFESLVFGFIGDVEFLLDDNRKLIHVRSASRLGYNDLGTNRRRVEAIRRLFENIK
jgi:uncharacterized protein (DUF1499 family)